MKPKCRNNKRIWITITVVAVVLLAAACHTVGDDKAKNTVMYVPYGKDAEHYVMIDQHNGSVFTVTMPENILDSKDRKITKDDLKKGNILIIYGDGIMLQTYPGQYPGVTKIKVKEEGKPSDADQYQDVVEQISSGIKSAARPYLSLEYQDGLGVVSAASTEGGFRWSYYDKNGDLQSSIADTAHILAWKEINNLNLSQASDITLNFSSQPDSIEVICWTSDMRTDFSDTSDVPDGEKMKPESEENQYVLKDVKPGSIYQVTGHWGKDSYVNYGFLT